jgi:hypothetical protein
MFHICPRLARTLLVQELDRLDTSEMNEQAKITQNVLDQCYDSYGYGHIWSRRKNHRSYGITVIRELPIAENRHAFTCPAKDLPALMSGPEQIKPMTSHEP